MNIHPRVTRTGPSTFITAGYGHSDADRSLSIKIDPRAPGGLVVDSFAGDLKLYGLGPVKDYARGLLGLPPFQPGARRGTAPKAEPKAAARAPSRTTITAAEIWRAGVDPGGTTVERYLERRCKEMPEEAAGRAIRLVPRCPVAGRVVPAMACLIRHVRSDEPQGIQVTPLTLDGRKAPVKGIDRWTFGRKAGGAIKITPDADVTMALGVGEGLETSPSMRRIPEFGHTAVWALIDAGNLEKLPVLGGVESLWIAVDYDASGMGDRAAAGVAARWRQAGREVFRVRPNAVGADLNDIVAGAAHG